MKVKFLQLLLTCFIFKTKYYASGNKHTCSGWRDIEETLIFTSAELENGEFEIKLKRLLAKQLRLMKKNGQIIVQTTFISVDKVSPTDEPTPTPYTPIDSLSRTTTTATTTTEEDLPEIHYGPVSDACRKDQSGECFWTEVRNIRNMTYTDAEQFCKSFDSVPAVIPDEVTFNDIVEHVRLTPPSSSIALWLGIKLDAMAIRPADAYSSWIGSHPVKGRTNIAIFIGSSSKGMLSYSVSQTCNGVVCWKPSRT